MWLCLTSVNTDIAYNNGKSLVSRTSEPEVKALLRKYNVEE